MCPCKVKGLMNTGGGGGWFCLKMSQRTEKYSPIRDCKTLGSTPFYYGHSGWYKMSR